MTAPTAVDLAHPIVALIHELRPNIPLSVVATLVVECLDVASCTILDREWAEARQRAWPEAIKLAHSSHTETSYAERRARDLADATQPRPNDYPGRFNRSEVA
jgi:hypothetical protein